MNSLIVQKTIFNPVKPGLYDATLVGIKGTSHPQFGLGYIWTFEVNSQGERTQVTGITSVKFTPKSKVWSWVMAFGIDPFSTGSNFDLGILFGKRVTVKIVQTTKANQTYSNVKELLPPARFIVKLDPEGDGESSEWDIIETSDLFEVT